MTTWRVPKQYTAKQIVYAYRHAQAHLDDYYLIEGWQYEKLTCAAWLRWFRSKLMAKINRNEPVRGRKDSYEYELELSRLRFYIGNRIVIDWVAPCLGPRVHAAMAHRLRSAIDWE